jgi:hypothetical protein
MTPAVDHPRSGRRTLVALAPSVGTSGRLATAISSRPNYPSFDSASPRRVAIQESGGLTFEVDTPARCLDPGSVEDLRVVRLRP